MMSPFICPGGRGAGLVPGCQPHGPHRVGCWQEGAVAAGGWQPLAAARSRPHPAIPVQPRAATSTQEARMVMRAQNLALDKLRFESHSLIYGLWHHRQLTELLRVSSVKCG